MIHPVAKIARIAIKKNTSILEALKIMDSLGVKMLIILENEKFTGLVTIGDIQRAIIKNIPLHRKVYTIIRKDIHVAKTTDNPEIIKQSMLTERDESMPVIDDDNNIYDIIFWDELFKGKTARDETILDLPVIIMAGGKGTRLKPLTNVIPKPLIPVGEKTIIEVIIDKFKSYGVHVFFISVNYKSEMIEFYFKDKKSPEYSLTFFKEPVPMGTIGSIKLIKDHIHNSFFVTNCDIIINQDYRDIYNFHKGQNNEITMVCALKTIYIPYGTVESGNGGSLLGLKEKPDLTLMINTGMYILEPHLFNEISTDKEFHITELIEKVKQRKGKVGVFPVLENQYFDIGDWGTYKETVNRLSL